MTEVKEIAGRAARMRERIVDMAAGPEGAHIGGSLSVTDVLAVLFSAVLRLRPEEPTWPGRDYLILSKGHSSAALYAALVERGFFPAEELATYARAGSRLGGHPLRKVPGVEFATGSLGHGLSLALGLALAARRDGRENRAFAVLGDGELQEGSVWEAAMAAAQLRLDNLVAIVDRNGLQISGLTEEVVGLDPLAGRWSSFGWAAEEVDGHDLAALLGVMGRLPLQPGRPSVIIARTVKAKGLKFAEGRKKCHYMTLSPDLHRRARAELGSPIASGAEVTRK